MRLSEFIEYFASLSKHDLRPTTLDRVYRPAFKSFLDIVGDKKLTDYTVRDVETYKAERLKTCSPVTFNIGFRTLKAAFNQALKWDLVKENPFCRSKQVRVPEKPPIHFSREEFEKLIAMVEDSVLKDLLIFAVLTGMRQGEIINLQWDDIDCDQKVIRITNRDGFVTKTGKTRVIPMSDDVYELLSGLKEPPTKSQVVFARHGGKMKQSYVEHKFKQHIRAAGLRDELKFHSLRHTFATWLVQSGASIYEIQKLLGHSDIKTTQIYAHLAASELHSAVNRISFRSRGQTEMRESPSAVK